MLFFFLLLLVPCRFAVVVLQLYAIFVRCSARPSLQH